MTTVRTRPTRESLLNNRVTKIDTKIFNNVIELVSKAFEVDIKKMAHKSRYRELVLARNMCYYILHTSYFQKASQIAPYFKRDRTTVLHGLNTFVNDIEVIPFYMEKYESVMDSIELPNNIYANK